MILPTNSVSVNFDNAGFNINTVYNTQERTNTKFKPLIRQTKAVAKHDKPIQPLASQSKHQITIEPTMYKKNSAGHISQTSNDAALDNTQNGSQHNINTNNNKLAAQNNTTKLVDNQKIDQPTNQTPGSSTKIRKKCILIHDSCHDKFDSDRFDNRYHIITYNANNLKNALGNRKLHEFLAKQNPDCIYLHLGLEDLANGISENQVTNMFNKLILELLKIPNAKICISDIIPCVGNQAITAKIHEVNRSVYDLISHIRANTEDRLCSYNNNRVAGHLRWKYGCETKYELSDRGKGILWLRLKYGLTKAVNLGSQKMNSNQSYRNITNPHNMSRYYNG